MINTRHGTNVVVDPPDEDGETPMTLTFDQITFAGNTTLSTSGTCDGLPGSFVVSDPMVCYDVSTDATFTGMIEVCVEYDENALAGDEVSDNVAFEPWFTGEVSVAPDVISPFVGLHKIYPNPFNPQTTIRFSVEGNEWAKISIYDLTGRLLAVLTNRAYTAGHHSVVWNGKDATGRAVPSGGYIVRLETESGVEARKVMLVR